jgi:O-antigen ligase
VVVVEVAGTAGTAGVVVVVLVVVVGVVQPVSDTRAATAKHERMNFFISIFFVFFIVLQAQDGIIARASLSGITLRGSGLNSGVSRTGR